MVHAFSSASAIAHGDLSGDLTPRDCRALWWAEVSEALCPWGGWVTATLSNEGKFKVRDWSWEPPCPFQLGACLRPKVFFFLYIFIFPPNFLRLLNVEQGLTQEIVMITTEHFSSNVPWWEALCLSLVLIDIGFPHVLIWELIRVKKHLVNNPHLKPPWSSTLIGCRQLDWEGLAELNRGSGLAIWFQSRAAQSSRSFSRVSLALMIYCRKVLDTWQRVDAEPLWPGSLGRCIQQHLCLS